MLTRRDTLKLAAAAAAARSFAPTVMPAEAARLLDAPLDAGWLPVHQVPGGMGVPDVYDPASYAAELDGIDLPSLAQHVAPEAMATYRQARATMVQEMPALADLPVSHPWTQLDEASMSLWCDAWTAGVRAGAAYEHLRQAVLGPTRICGICDGFGVVGNGAPDAHANEYERCRACGGIGTVTTPAPAIG
ncbi:MAG: hypothetical protein M3R02_14995 [Chloroflexota bacterium]|nr:hypothetical protein [Chloroflexota bacterium]